MHAAVGAGFVFGSKGGGSTEVSIKLMLEVANAEPDFKGEIEFKGLVLSFMSFATASVEKANTERKTSTVKVGSNALEDFDDENEDLKEQAGFKDSKELWTIFAPRKKPFWEN